MNYIRPVDRNQATFMNKLDDLVSRDNPVRLLDLLVDKIIQENSKQFSLPEKKSKPQKGRPAYSPQCMHKLYLYGYLNGIRSSRKLEKECNRNIEVIWLLGDLRPDFKTIADFRKNNKEQIMFFSKKVREFLKDNGYIKGDRVAVDGSKMKAFARREMLNHDKIEKRLININEKIDDYLSMLAENDIRENVYEELGELGSPTELNQHLVEQVVKLQKEIEKLQAAKEKLEKEDRNYISTIDKDANLMKSRDGLIPAYNVQIAVDSEHKMIAASEVSTDPIDSKLLRPMLGVLKADLDIEPKEVVADNGYENQSELAKIEKAGKTECYVPLQEKNKEDIEFEYDKKRDEYLCSEGKRLILKQKNKKKRNSFYDVYQGIECNGCLIRERCTNSKHGRILHRNHNDEWQKKYKEKIASKKGKQIIKERKEIVEHPFGTIRYWMGKIPLLLRGKGKVPTEINIYVTVYNFRRLLSISSFNEIMDKINKYNWATA